MQRQFHEFSVSPSMDTEDLLRYITYMSQELTLSIALSEREPITFRCKAWDGECNLHNIVNMYCAVYRYHVPQARKILR